jgi:glyoxylate reductase
MGKPPILITRRLPASVLSRLGEACAVDLYEGGAAIPPEELLARVTGVHALVCLLTDRVDREVIDAARNLRIIANVAVGYDNVDVAHARSRGVVVTNTPDVLTESVAEFTWGLILAVSRRIAEGERLLRRGEWRGWALDFMLGSDLAGKQLGIVGMGRIGLAVAARAGTFGMDVAYASVDPVEPSLYTGRLAMPALTPMSFDQLLSTSDVVSLHVPLTPDTRHLVDRRALARMKRSAFLINTARGPIVDEEGLAWALGERLIAGAGLDVYEDEPRVNPGLMGLENVVLAPHLGSATVETRTAMADLAASNVLAVLSGRPPLTPVAAGVPPRP